MSTTNRADASAGPGRVHAVGVVPATGRGDLPHVLLHDEPLVLHASRALTSAGIRLVPPDVAWGDVQNLAMPVVLQDPLCPLTPPEFIATLVRRAGSGVVQVGVRPVTDTVKSVRDGVVGATVDRSALLVVASPVVLPAQVVATADGWGDLSDFTALVSGLRERFEVALVEVESVGRRVGDATDVLLLEAFQEL